MKRTVPLYLEYDYVRVLKARNVNISKEVNDYLAGLCGSIDDRTRKDELQKEQERINQELAVINKRENELIGIESNPAVIERVKMLAIEKKGSVPGHLAFLERKCGLVVPAHVFEKMVREYDRK